MQHLIPSKTRATVLSANEMANHFIAAIILVAGGVLLDALGPKLGLIFAGLLAIPAFIVFTLLKEEKE